MGLKAASAEVLTIAPLPCGYMMRSASWQQKKVPRRLTFITRFQRSSVTSSVSPRHEYPPIWADASSRPNSRSEEHTSELQSLMRNSYAVFCLKKQTQHTSA